MAGRGPSDLKELNASNQKMRADLEGNAAELKSQIDSTKNSSAV